MPEFEVFLATVRASQVVTLDSTTQLYTVMVLLHVVCAPEGVQSFTLEEEKSSK